MPESVQGENRKADAGEMTRYANESARLHHLKNGVLDPQGKAIGHALNGLGFGAVGEVRQGKVIDIELSERDAGQGPRRASRTMCEKLLANTSIEKYEIELKCNEIRRHRFSRFQLRPRRGGGARADDRQEAAHGLAQRQRTARMSI